MTHAEKTGHESYPDTHHDVYSKTIFGFWVYIMTDFMLFATIFATYAVLAKSTYGGPSAGELFHLPFTMTQTLLMLTCAFTSSLAGACSHSGKKNGTIALFALTFFLGVAFMGMELTEFSRLVSDGFSWRRSAFLSAYFTLVGTYGLHMVLGLLWILVLLLPLCRDGLTAVNVKRLTCLRMFWQFLSVVWVFIFCIVYLLGRI